MWEVNCTYTAGKPFAVAFGPADREKFESELFRWAELAMNCGGFCAFSKLSAVHRKIDMGLAVAGDSKDLEMILHDIQGNCDQLNWNVRREMLRALATEALAHVERLGAQPGFYESHLGITLSIHALQLDTLVQWFFDCEARTGPLMRQLVGVFKLEGNDVVDTLTAQARRSVQEYWRHMRSNLVLMGNGNDGWLGLTLTTADNRRVILYVDAYGDDVKQFSFLCKELNLPSVVAEDNARVVMRRLGEKVRATQSDALEDRLYPHGPTAQVGTGSWNSGPRDRHVVCDWWSGNTTAVEASPAFDVMAWMKAANMCEGGCSSVDLEGITIREAIKRAYRAKNPYDVDAYDFSSSEEDA